MYLLKLLLSYLVSQHQSQHVIRLIQFSQGKCNMWIVGPSLSVLEVVSSHRCIYMSAWRLYLLLQMLDSCVQMLAAQDTYSSSSTLWQSSACTTTSSSLLCSCITFWLGYLALICYSLKKQSYSCRYGMALAVQYTLHTSTHSWLTAVSWKTGILHCRP